MSDALYNSALCVSVDISIRSCLFVLGMRGLRTVYQRP